MLHFLLILIAGAWANPVWDHASSGKNPENALVEFAESLLESRYRYGGKSPSGFDCSGFTQFVYHHAAGKQIPRSSSAQYKLGKKVKLARCKPGDLVFFRHSRKINHVGIIQKHSRKGIWMIHSSSSRGVIVEEITGSAYWKSRIAGVKRVL